MNVILTTNVHRYMSKFPAHCEGMYILYVHVSRSKQQFITDPLQYNYLLDKVKFVRTVYCTFSMRESLVICNNVTITLINSGPTLCTHFNLWHVHTYVYLYTPSLYRTNWMMVISIMWCQWINCCSWQHLI